MEHQEPIKVWNWISALTRDIPGITSTMVSETIPNDTMSMAEMVDRFVRGHEIPGLKNFPFDSDTDIELPDIAMMSKTQVAQFKLDLAENIKETEQDVINLRKKIAVNKQAIKDATAAKKEAEVSAKEPTVAPKSD